MACAVQVYCICMVRYIQAAAKDGDAHARAAADHAQFEERLEAEREKRVAHLQQQAARRIAKHDIAMGFSAWQEQWEEAARQKRMLAAACARLARPVLAAAVAAWRAGWRAAEAGLQHDALSKLTADLATARLEASSQARRMWGLGL